MENNIKNNIKVERARINFTQKELATAIGVSFQTICKWEAEIDSCPTLKLLEMRNVFGCSLDYLVGLVDERGGVYYARR